MSSYVVYLEHSNKNRRKMKFSENLLWRAWVYAAAKARVRIAVPSMRIFATNFDMVQGESPK
jgi:hypothetical protein